jgi:hypothetical protein
MRMRRTIQSGRLGAVIFDSKTSSELCTRRLELVGARAAAAVMWHPSTRGHLSGLPT